MVTSPGSALSVKVVIPGAGVGGADITVNVDRTTTSPAAYTGTYQVGQAVAKKATSFNLTFYAGAGESGKIVATAAAPVTWSGSNAVFGTVTLTGKVSKVNILAPGNLMNGDPAIQLAFDALDSSNASLALSPGSANWAIASGSAIILTRDGVATPTAVGTSAVTATVDGVASTAANVVVAAPAITVTDLTPSGAKAALTAVQGGQYAGYGTSSSVYAPVYWPSLTTAPIDLTPSGATAGGQVHAISSSQQGGEAFFGTVHAALWSGTAASFVDLNPAGAASSRLYGMGPASQVGYANIGGANHAIVWTGTAGSFVDLNPAGASGSGGQAVAGGNQFGDADFGASFHAAMWSGSAASFFDLNPSGATNSQINCASGSVQGGTAFLGGWVAGEWTGSAASFVNLAPAGSTGSAVYGAAGNFLSGYATIATASHAVLWNGTTHTFLDLNASLGATFVSSIATSLEPTAKGVTVVGYATDSSSVYHAIVWFVPNALLP